MTEPVPRSSVPMEVRLGPAVSWCVEGERELRVRTFQRVAAAFSACASLAACAGALGPEDIESPGIYALNDGDLVRLDGSPQWERETWGERQDLDPEVVLLAYYPGQGSGAEATAEPVMRLRRVPFLRYEIDARTGARSEPSGSRWVASELPAYDLPIKVTATPERPGAVQARPVGPLEEGLYTVQFGQDVDGTLARLGIDWEDVDAAEYGKRYCIDRYVDGARHSDAPCAAAASIETETGGLRVQDLQAGKETVQGTAFLLAEGALVNDADAPRRVPPLRASVVSDRGAEVASWLFRAESAYLLPRDATTFRTELKRPPAEASDVRVDLAAGA